MQAWSKKGWGAFIVAAFLLALAACSPRFDWREIPNPEAGYAALFPARPGTVTRPLLYGAQTIELTLQAAPVGDMSFTVGHAQLPATAGLGEVVEASAWMARFETALLGNLDARITQTHPPKSPALRDISADGTLRARRRDVDGIPAKLRARFYLHQGQLYEVIVIGPAAGWDEDAAATFLDGFRIL